MARFNACPIKTGGDDTVIPQRMRRAQSAGVYDARHALRELCKGTHLEQALQAEAVALQGGRERDLRRGRALRPHARAEPRGPAEAAGVHALLPLLLLLHEGLAQGAALG